MGSNELATTDSIKGLFASNIKAIRNTVGSKSIADRLVNLAIEGIRKVPDLQKCDSIDVFNKLRQTVELGLEPFTPLHHAVLLPFKNSKFNRYDCTLIIEYQGLIKLAKNSGEIEDIYAKVVYDKEPYEYEEGLSKTLKHTPLPVARRGKEKVAVYAVAVHKNKSRSFVWMWAEDVEAIKSRSRAKSSGPWVTDEEAMWCKTAIRRLSKTLPLSVAFNTAANVDEKEELAFHSAIDVTPGAEPEKAISLSDQVKKKQEKKEPVKEAPVQTKEKPEAADQQLPPQNALHNAILTYCNGDEEQGNIIACHVTNWNGKGLNLAEILNANDRRCQRALETLDELIAADSLADGGDDGRKFD